MKLLIVSNMMHHADNGRIIGHGPTVREINYLAQLFDEVRHIGCLHTDEPSKLELQYEDARIQLVPLPPAGGAGLRDKLGILKHSWLYFRTIYRELSWADVVHVRTPANIPLIAIVILAFVQYPKTRWIKFAGNWQPEKPDALSYRFQRWWLKKGWHRGYVTVNGEWDNLPPFFRSFVNPCLTDEQIQRGRQVAASKTLETPVRIIFVGALKSTKGVDRVLEIVKQLQVMNVSFRLDLIGDSNERSVFEERVSQLEVVNQVYFHGWLSRDHIDAFYEAAHFILLPSKGEGWPKVLSEAMGFGVVPLASKVGSISYFIDGAQAGHTYYLDDIGGYRDQILEYLHNPEIWKIASENAVKLAERFSYSNYLSDVRRMLKIE
jgi:glycosyltransferase involved in cell wall biosynthesis